jgi:hypothetical protein
MDRQTPERVLANAIRRTQSVERVAFEQDGEHVVIGPVGLRGEVAASRHGVAVRYRLGATAQRFLSGEFEGELPADAIELLAPASRGDG